MHQLARAEVKNGNLTGADSGMISLFFNNYENADAKLISDTINKIKPDREDIHQLAWNIKDLAKKYNDVGLANALKWGYEKTPWSDCRRRIVVQLDAINRFDGEILYECQFDADESTASLAREKINSPKIEK